MKNNQSKFIIPVNITITMFIFVSAYFLFNDVSTIIKSNDVIEEVKASVFCITITTVYGKQTILNVAAIFSLFGFIINMASFVYTEIRQRHKKQED